MRSKPAVLIVDDEPHVRETACQMFALLGIECFDAMNGEDALRILSNEPAIGLLFTDVRMPGLDGLVLVDKAKAIRPHLKIVLTSGWVGESALGALKGMRFLAKPYRLAHLKRIVGEWFGTEEIV